MKFLLSVHLGVSEVLIRLLQLHVLWLVGALRGAVVCGVFPATAALAQVARRDAGTREIDGWKALKNEFFTEWRREFRQSNVLGWVLLGSAALLIGEMRFLRVVSTGPLATMVGGLLWMLAAIVIAAAILAWPLAAHFEGSVFQTLRRALVFLVGRPAAALSYLGVFIGVIAAYVLLPGLLPVFGLAAPAWLASAVLWRMGALERYSAPDPDADSSSKPSRPSSAASARIPGEGWVRTNDQSPIR